MHKNRELDVYNSQAKTYYPYDVVEMKLRQRPKGYDFKRDDDQEEVWY